MSRSQQVDLLMQLLDVEQSLCCRAECTGPPAADTPQEPGTAHSAAPQPPHGLTCCREETHTAILSKEPYLPSHLSMECKDFLRQVCPPVMAALWCWPVMQSEQQAHGCCLISGWEHIWRLSVTSVQVAAPGLVYFLSAK